MLCRRTGRTPDRRSAAESRARAALLGARAERRAGLWPTLSLGGGLSERDRTLLLATPIGSFPFQPARAEEHAQGGDAGGDFGEGVEEPEKAADPSLETEA